MMLLAATWFLITTGFGRVNGGEVLGEYKTRADCEAARPADCCAHIDGEPDMLVEYACVPAEFVRRR